MVNQFIGCSANELETHTDIINMIISIIHIFALDCLTEVWTCEEMSLPGSAISLDEGRIH